MAVSKNKARIPKQQRGIESKEKIISAATVLFAEKGYQGTNALEIAAKADVATGTFYSYFNNKKEVFIEIIKRIFKNIFDKVLLNLELKIHKNQADNYKEGKRLAHLIINQIISEYRVNVKLLREILAMILLDKEIEKIRRKEEKKVIDLLVFYMQTYKSYIRISDFEAAAVLLLKFMEDMIHQIKFASTGVDEKRLLKEIEDMICRYLLPEN
ncbi:MAG TPA: TetR family transcriptional regulator [Smithella sp.]|nr:TetR family transcriptional regulator [Smithella sp.]